MTERQPSIAEIHTALSALRRDIDLPEAPALAGRVVSRLSADRAASTARRPLPGRALWTPRTRVVLATLAILALLTLAATARLVVGAVEVRVVPIQPTTSRSPSTAPLDPDVLGAPVAHGDLADAAGFDVAIPAGRPPGAAYVSASPDGAAIMAWFPDERSPSLAETPWGLVLIEIPGPSDELLVKQVSAFEDTDEITLDGDRAFWIHAPHELVVVTDDAEERFHVEGNVLVWEHGGITYRLETPLGLEAARRLAGSIT